MSSTGRRPVALLVPALILAGCFGAPTELPPPALHVVAPPGARAGQVVRIRAWAPGRGGPTAPLYRFSSTHGYVESNGAEATFRPYPGTGTGTVVVNVVMIVDGAPQAHDSVQIAIYDQAVILKADDLTHDTGGDLPIGWGAFLAYARRNDLHAGLGLIAKSLETGSAAFRGTVRDLATESRFEIWNHGYDHVLNAVAPDGSRYSEFSGRSVEVQRAHLERAQRLARDSLGITLRAFGAPGNAIDQNTAVALAQVPELAIWLYGVPTPGKLVLPRVMNIEDPLPRPNYERFVKTYLPDAPVLVLQIHPSRWSDADFQGFDRIIAFLRARNVAFMTPSEYAATLAGTVAGTVAG